MSTIGAAYDDPTLRGEAVERDDRALLGQVMGFVAVTVGFAARGAYLGRDLSGGTGSVLFIAVVIAASIFLDVFNVFLFWLDLLGGER